MADRLADYTVGQKVIAATEQIEQAKEVTAEDLTPEQRQIVGLIRDHGPQEILKLCHRLRPFGRKVGRVQIDICRLSELGIVRVHGDSNLVSLSDFGDTFQLNTLHGRRQGRAQYRAGMLDKHFDEAEERLQKEEQRQLKRRKRATINGGVEYGKSVTSDVTLPELPKDFVRPAIRQLYHALRCGNFDKLRSLADSLERQWQGVQAGLSPLAELPFGIRLATHLGECRNPDGSGRMCVRIINAVETICSATLGSIRENWPLAFVKVPNMGEKSIELLGRVLFSAGLIEAAEFEGGMRSADEALRGIKNSCA